jgi:hypothetical protein
MLLGPQFKRFVDKAPVNVMVRGTLERVLDPDVVDRLFDDHAVQNYCRKIAFSQCVAVMDAVVFRTEPSVGAWIENHVDELQATRQALYDKLRRIEPQVAAALVRHSGRELSVCVEDMPNVPARAASGLRLLVLDGNHLAGTEHRLKGLRGTRSAALPGQALVLYDPRLDLIVDVVPGEDAHAQERALFGQVLPLIAANDCIVADRNFCTTGFLFELAKQGAFFAIRQHGSTLSWQIVSQPRPGGTDAQGRSLSEEDVLLTHSKTGETMTVRRITIPLPQGNAKGEKQLHVLTNVPAERVSAVEAAEWYKDRWSVERAFRALASDLRSEIDTLGYPRAALLGFCLACVAYNAVSLVKSALRAEHGAEFVREKLSSHYLARSVAKVAGGMEIAIDEAEWLVFREMSQPQFLASMLELAKKIDIRKFTKHKRSPKTKQPKKQSGKRIHHVSTAKIVAARKRK